MWGKCKIERQSRESSDEDAPRTRAHCSLSITTKCFTKMMWRQRDNLSALAFLAKRNLLQFICIFYFPWWRYIYICVTSFCLHWPISVPFVLIHLFFGNVIRINIQHRNKFFFLVFCQLLTIWMFRYFIHCHWPKHSNSSHYKTLSQAFHVISPLVKLSHAEISQHQQIQKFDIHI